MRVGMSDLENLIENKQALIDSLSKGCKPNKADWRIGSEHEKFVFHRSDYSPLAFEGKNGRPGIRDILRAYEKYGWEPVCERSFIIAEKKDGASLSLEPGGQFELSGAPLETIYQTCAEVTRHLNHAKAIGDELDVGFLGLGFHPTLKRQNAPIMPKARYDIMRSYMPKKGNMGLDMMLRTATVQVNLDFASEADMVDKFRLSLALQPIATALFANSPFKEGKVTDYKSLRSHVWTDTDPDRTGILDFVFEDGMSFERYVDYALDVPMYFVKRDDAYIDASGQSFRDFLRGELPALPGEKPLMQDWEDHLTTLFPEVRLKTFLEMRGADGAPWAGLCSMPAFWVGLLYDDAAQKMALDMIEDWSIEDIHTLRNIVPSKGLNASFKGKPLVSWARDIIAIADIGLRNRGCIGPSGENEQGFLNFLWEIVDNGKTQADILVEKYNGEWQGNIDHVFKDYSY